jgi:DNA polymerase-3 subunit gamma/tau
MPGGIDTDAIRRSWPDVLTKIATISRVTWSFVSQNTRVLDYNGERLLLGLSTDGLLSALRGRNHAEVVRQALIEVIGVDTTVEGVLSTDAASTDPVSAGPASADAPEPDDDWNPSAPSRSSASAPLPPTPNASDMPAQAPTPDRPSTPRQRAKAAVAQEASRRRTSASSVADDSVVSPDDEDIEEAGDMGQPVIERVLGGMVIGELDQ